MQVWELLEALTGVRPELNPNKVSFDRLAELNAEIVIHNMDNHDGDLNYIEKVEFDYDSNGATCFINAGVDEE